MRGKYVYQVRAYINLFLTAIILTNAHFTDYKVFSALMTLSAAVIVLNSIGQAFFDENGEIFK